MTTFQPPPHPLHIHQTTFLPLPAAESTLSTFLSRSQIDPSYRPDSTLSNRGDGPQSNSGGTGNVNLTLFHLERICRGMRGENLGVVPETTVVVGGEVGEEQGVEGRTGTKRGRGVDERRRGAVDTEPVVVMEAETTGGNKKRRTTETDDANADEWQDREDFERAQSVKVGEVGDRDAAFPDAEVDHEDVRVVGEGDTMDVDGEEEAGGKRFGVDYVAMEAAEVAGGKKTKRDKEERKRAKKERRKADLRAKG